MELKKCPYCEKNVLAIAKSCKHCGKSFDAKPVEEVKLVPNTKPLSTAPTIPPSPPPKAAAPVSTVLTAPTPPTAHTTPHHKEKHPTKIIIAAIATVAAIAVLVVIVINTLSKKKQLELPSKAQTIIEEVENQTENGAISKGEETSKAVESQTVRYASIQGKSVIFRASYSTTSNKLGYLNENEQVTVLSEYNPSNTDEAISNKNIKLHSSYGTHTHTLPKGKAVKVISYNDDQCDVSFTHPQYGYMSATVSRSDLDFISGNKWYSIKRNTGETGWVYSKFVRLY